MNLIETKQIIIPEGKVLMIQCGTEILWEAQNTLVCNPVLSLSVTKVSDTATTATCTMTLSGISPELIVEKGILYSTATSVLTVDGSGRTCVIMHGAVGDTLTGYTFTYPVKDTSYFSYRAFVKYTDLSGNVEYAYSNQINSTFDNLPIA